MPTNQSSPWGGAQLQTSSNADHIPTTSVGTHTNTLAATEVRFSKSSLELSKRKDQAQHLTSNVTSPASCLTQTAVTPPVVFVRENGQVAAVPDGSPNLPQQHHRIQKSNQILVAGLKQTAPLTILKKESQIGVNVLLTGAVQERTKRERQTGNSLMQIRRHTAAGDMLLGIETPQNLFIKGQASLQKGNPFMLEAADFSSLPSVPPLCLNLCDYQRSVLGKDALSLGNRKVEIRSTTTRRSCSAKLATKSSQAQSSCTVTAFNNQLLVRGGPPAVVVAPAILKPQTVASPDLNKKNHCPSRCTLSSLSIKISIPTAGHFPNGPMPRVASAPQRKQVKSLDAITGAVATQISTIHLTNQGQFASASSSSPSLTEERLYGETRLSGQKCVMQVDGCEEDLPDELENACSDDNDSDCSSLSTTSIVLLSGVEEPMSLEVEDDREEKQALVPSLFHLIPPTLYFSNANEKVELLPAEQRRLLKWKMSTVTPNVVKHTIARSHFKVTKKSHDWLGCWGHHMKSPAFKALGEHQKLNHFPGTFQIGRKDRLWRNLSKMQVRFGKQEFSFFPRTFVLPQDIKLLRKAWEDRGSRQKWIIKPPASARGIGIQVIHKWSQMPRKRPLLVQKYLHKPYLISGNKFDLRIYVYVTSYDPLRIYIYSDGLVRFASCKSVTLKCLI